jgi:hypothetical protein
MDEMSFTKIIISRHSGSRSDDVPRWKDGKFCLGDAISAMQKIMCRRRQRFPSLPLWLRSLSMQGRPLA